MVQNTQQPLIVLADGSTRTVGSQATKNNIMAAKLLSNVLIIRSKRNGQNVNKHYWRR